MTQEEKKVDNKSITLGAMKILSQFRESNSGKSFRGFIDHKLFIVTPTILSMIKTMAMSNITFAPTGEEIVLEDSDDKKPWPVYELEDGKGGKWELEELKLEQEIERIKQESGSLEI